MKVIRVSEPRKPCWVERKVLEENNLNVVSSLSRQALVALVAELALPWTPITQISLRECTKFN